MCQKFRVGPGVGKCPTPGRRKICKCPTPGTDKAGKYLAVAPGGGGEGELGAAGNDCINSGWGAIWFLLGPVYMEWGTPVKWGWFLLFSRSGEHKTKETYPTRPGSPTPCKQALRS